MSKEDPILKKCCCIFPIRPSLVIFAVFKIIANLSGIGFFGYTCLTLGVNRQEFIYALVCTLALILDIFLMSLLIVAVSKKNSYLLKISYYYSLTWLLTTGVTTVVLLTLVYTRSFYLISKDFYSSDISLVMNLLIHVAIIFAYILLHTYMIVLMKGEITKLSNVGNYNVYHDQESMNLRTETDNEYPYGRYQ